MFKFELFSLLLHFTSEAKGSSPPFTSVNADDLERQVLLGNGVLLVLSVISLILIMSPVIMPISFLHYIQYTVYQPLLFENVHGKNVFQFLVKEKKTFLKEFESFYFLFVWPTCKLEEKRGEKNMCLNRFYKCVKLFFIS